MANMTTYDSQYYAQLLGNETMDASGGVLFSSSSRIDPDETNRTILIGLGGTGMKTIDYVKGVISKRLNSNWPQYVGFLGIDSDNNELKSAKYIEPSEFVSTTRPGIDARINDERQFPLAWQPFAELEDTKRIQDPNGPGAGKRRLNSKLKIHDKAAGEAMGVDEMIVEKLGALRTSLAAPAQTSMYTSTYEVYVIGSIGGGTGSGAFLEMPALIREALGKNNVNVYAIIFLPDTVIGLDPGAKSRMEANGYASLKELNYFEGMKMRENYAEQWPYNLPSQPMLPRNVNDTRDFYRFPFLMGTLSGSSSPASADEARSVVAEFLINTLGKTVYADDQPMPMASFCNNAMQLISVKQLQPGTAEVEAPFAGAHVFPRHFAALGFKQACPPQKIVRSYEIAQLCSAAGVKAVDSAKRTEMIATGDTTVMIPFRAADDLLTANEGTQAAAEMLEPIKNEIITLVRAGKFSIAGNCTAITVDWDSIKNNSAEASIQQISKKYVEDMTRADSYAALNKGLEAAFNKFRNKVREYVQKEGPIAFANLYHGRYKTVDGVEGVGLAKMIRYLVDGRDAQGKDIFFLTAAAALNDVNRAKADIDSLKQSDLGRLLGTKKNPKESQCNAWRESRQRLVNAEVCDKYRAHVFGSGHALQTHFAEPAAVLCEQLEAFGYILESMCNIYSIFGNQMSDYATFADATDDSVSSNIAALHPSTFDWLKDQAKQSVANANAKQFRDELVDNFFEDTASWLDVPDGTVAQVGGIASLVQRDRPVPARECFDAVAAKCLPPTSITVGSIVEQLVTNGNMDYQSTANRIVTDLISNGRPLIHADLPGGAEVYRLLKYPQSLNSTPNGQAFVNALIKAAETQGINANQIYASASDANIVLYYFVAPFEIYNLKHLANWRASYETTLLENDNLLHGKSPRLEISHDSNNRRVYTEKLMWRDFPPITRGDVDERKPDPQTGEISREGKFLLELDKLVEEAKKYGVLYCEQVDNKYTIKRVHCDKSVNWTLNVEVMAPDASGLLPMGKALAATIAEQNGKTLAEISRDVRLVEGNLIEGPWSSESFAWSFAVRNLRANVPMYLEVKDTVARFREWTIKIEEFNRIVRERLKPAMMSFMIKARILHKDATGVWKLRLKDGTEKIVANLSEATINMLASINPTDARLVRGGFTAYYLYNKLAALPEMAGDAFNDTYVRSKERLLTFFNESDMDAITAGTEMAAFIDTERAALVDMGAKLEDAVDANKELPERYMTAMRDKGVTSADVMKEIRLFYYRTSLWESL